MPDVEVFLCSTREDEDLCKKLETQLAPYRRSGFIQSIWSSRKIDAGMERGIEAQKHLNACRVIVLLVSPDFMDSQECYALMLQAMDRHTEGEARVVPVLLRPVEWAKAPFSRLQVLPKNEKPITSWSNREEAFLEVAQDIYQAIENSYSDSRGARETQPPPHLPTVSAQGTALSIETSTEFPFTHVRTLIDHRGPVASVAFSQDGQLLVSDSWDDTFPAVEPVRCLDPLLWILYQLGIFDTEDRNPILQFMNKILSYFKRLCKQA